LSSEAARSSPRRGQRGRPRAERYRGQGSGYQWVGKVIVDSRFSKIDRNTYKSPDYDGAANKVEITVNSGAGNVSVNTN
jgi:hypothetical protein